MTDWIVIHVLVNLIIVLALILGGAVLLVVFLYLLRFFRIESIKRLWRADLPSFQELTATIKVFGQEIAANAKMDSKRDEQISTLEQRLTYLERTLETQSQVSKGILKELQRRSDRDE